MHCVSAIVSCRIRNLHRNPCDLVFDDIIDRWSGRDGEAGSPTSVRADIATYVRAQIDNGSYMPRVELNTQYSEPFGYQERPSDRNKSRGDYRLWLN